MLNLIRKDLAVQKREKTVIFALLLGAVAAVILQDTPAFAVGNIVIATYLMTVYVNAYDHKYNAEIAFVSLPLRRSDMVTGRYLSVWVFTAIVVVFSIGTSIIFRTMGWFGVQEGWTLPLLGLIVIAVSLYYSLFLPLYFWFGYMKSRWANYISMVLTYGALGVLQESIPIGSTPSQAAVLSQMLDVPIFPVFVLGALALFALSALVSIQIYKRKEF